MIISTDIEFAVGRRDPETLRSYRAFKSRQAQLRERPTISGRVVEFLARSAEPVLYERDLPAMYQSFLHGAFSQSLSSGQNIRALLIHDDQWEIGHTDDYSLELWEDADGLQYRLALDHETRLGRLLFNCVKGGHFIGMSMGFRPVALSDIFYSGETRVFCNVTLSEVSFILPGWRPIWRTGTARLDVPISVLRRQLERAL